MNRRTFPIILLIVGLAFGLAYRDQTKPASFPYEVNFNEFSSDIVINGLSTAEVWGRWSQGKEISFSFNRPLPQSFRLELKLNAFGPNIGQSAEVSVGSQTQQIKLSAEPTRYTLEFADVSGDAIRFKVPQPTSPLSLGASEDSRELGIGFYQLRVSN